MMAHSRFARPAHAHLLSLALCICSLAVLATCASAQAPFLHLGIHGGVPPYPGAQRSNFVSACLTEVTPQGVIPVRSNSITAARTFPCRSRSR